jgi:hypothetical protein
MSMTIILRKVAVVAMLGTLACSQSQLPASDSQGGEVQSSGELYGVVSGCFAGTQIFYHGGTVRWSCVPVHRQVYHFRRGDNRQTDDATSRKQTTGWLRRAV